MGRLARWVAFAGFCAALAAIPAGSFAWLAAGPDAAPGEGEAKKGEAKKKEPELAFRTLLGRVSFKKAREAFGEKNWREALRQFQRARRYAKDAATRTAVDRWIKGVEGGAILSQLERRVKANAFGSAYLQALKTAPRYAQTPAGPLYEAFLVQIRPRAVHPIEGFEHGGPYSPKFGKVFVEDPDYVREGKRSLRWTCKDQHSIALRIKNVPPDWTAFSHLGFWMYARRGSASTLDLIICSKTYRRDRPDGFMYKVNPPKEGWKLFLIDLAKDVRKYGKADLGQMAFIQFQLPSRKNFRAWFDDFFLVRKAQAPGKKASGPPRKGAAGRTRKRR